MQPLTNKETNTDTMVTAVCWTLQCVRVGGLWQKGYLAYDWNKFPRSSWCLALMSHSSNLKIQNITAINAKFHVLSHFIRSPNQVAMQGLQGYRASVGGAMCHGV